ncbi:hypothetical protein ACF3DV_13150 [Chlorogloeopsis fritschii PCC 9212]|uniref:Uncharacterized protein n=1 Tax=Chlorogloeopsis fritschii PCC 6912 TaxID=211165 RepID=A0A433NRR6_CHLFR|nr:hypothetical protein [Chlorogloeopsis fritschii]RUR86890.1 hypothetical protein PCC6912_03330 [Chlorogloeopsis fritschii PCC 6912]
MKKQVTFLFSIFTGTVFVATPVVLAVPSTDTPKSPTSPNLEAKTTIHAAALTLKDLPPGFKELPPQLKTAIATQLEPLKQAIAKDNLPLNHFFAFIEPEKMELVMGFTGTLTSQRQQAQFDAALKQVQKPEFEKEIKKLEPGLRSLQVVKFMNYKKRPEFNHLANASSGFSIGAKIEQLPVNFDVIGFRRQSFGAFTAVMHMTDKEPSISVKDVVTKLDRRVSLPSSLRNLPGISK